MCRADAGADPSTKATAAEMNTPTPSSATCPDSGPSTCHSRVSDGEGTVDLTFDDRSRRESRSGSRTESRRSEGEGMFDKVFEQLAVGIGPPLTPRESGARGEQEED